MKVVCFYFEKKVDLKNIAEIFFRYTPQIAVSENALFLEIEQCSRMYSEAEFLNLAEAIFLKLEIAVKVGVAPSVPLALASASLGTKRLERIPLSFLRHFLFPFHGDEKQGALLTKIIWYFEKLGLRTVKELSTIPPRELSSRFGAMGLLLHQRVNDSSLLLWPKFIPEEKVREKRDFDAEVQIDSVEPLVFVIKGLLDRIYLRLLARDKTLKTFEVRLQPEYVITIDLSFTNISIKTLLQLFRDKVSASLQRNPLPGEITGVEILVLEMAPYQRTQRDFFNPKKEENEESYLELVNRLSLKLGEKKVFKASLNESYLPEKNWGREKSGNSFLPSDPLPSRPLRLLPEPVRLPCLAGKVYFDGKAIELKNISRPEVVFSDWWNRNEERVYFKARSHLGSDLWIYKNRETYFLHGLFD